MPIDKLLKWIGNEKMGGPSQTAITDGYEFDGCGVDSSAGSLSIRIIITLRTAM
jgi:hypothetical protein